MYSSRKETIPNNKKKIGIPIGNSEDITNRIIKNPLYSNKQNYFVAK